MNGPKELYTIEYSNGEMVDITDSGGFSVFLTCAEAEDYLEEPEPGENPPQVVRFIREEQ